MKRYPALVLVASQLLMSACYHAERIEPRNTAERRLDSIAASVLAGKIGKVEILQIRLNTSFIAQVTPEVLENAWDFRYTIRHIDGDRLPRLATALRTATIGTERTGADLRWGVILYSSTEEERRLGAIYFDRTGRRGALDDVPVSFENDALIELRTALLPPYQ